MACLKRLKARFLGAAVLCIVLIFSACSGEDATPADGDTDTVDSSSDGDSSVDGDSETIDPCAELQCEPGGECLKRKNNVPYCFCNSGYHANSDFTQCLPDEAGGDADTDTDYVEDCLPVGEGPFPDLKPCACADVPCISSMPFQYTENTGEFKVAFDDLHGILLFNKGIWGDRFVFYNLFVRYPAHSDYTGVYLVDFPSTTVAQLTKDEKIADTIMFGDIYDNKVFFSKSEGWIVSNDVDYDFLYELNISNFEIRPLVNSETPKIDLRCWEDNIYWKDHRTDPQSDHYDLYTINEAGEEIKLNQIPGGNVVSYDIYDKHIAYNASYYGLVLIDIENNEEKLVDQTSTGFFGDVAVGTDIVTWNDYSLTQSTGICGSSIAVYNLDTNQKSFFKETSGFNDYMVHDIWEDWLVYTTCRDGSDSYSGQCCGGDSTADLFLHYLPSGEEWQLTDTPGGKLNARMYDHLIIWTDSRATPNSWTGSQDLYGIDLCLHPELKDYFESCKDGAEKK